MPPRPATTLSKFLIPAQNSRHRTACLALFRALLRLAPDIKLPNELSEGWGAGRNPIAIYLKRAFRRNLNDVSPRIVYPALTAGYRMLSVLHNAATDANSTHHAEVISFLQARHEERQRSLANRSSPPEEPQPAAVPPPSSTLLPLLVDVTPAPTARNPDPRPEFITPHRPRPQSELGGTGRRQIPRLDMAGDFPFLRLTKPQPWGLNHILRARITKRFERIYKIGDLKDESLPAAKLEDQWEAQMARLMAAEGRSRRNHHQGVDSDWEDEHNNGIGGGRDERSSHVYTVQQYGIQNLTTTLSRERVVQVARADAMRRLIDQETELAEKEKVERAANRRARWEARMLELHGEGWRDLFPNLKDIDDSQRGKDKQKQKQTPVSLN